MFFVLHTINSPQTYVLLRNEGLELARISFYHILKKIWYEANSTYPKK